MAYSADIHLQIAKKVSTIVDPSMRVLPLEVRFTRRSIEGSETDERVLHVTQAVGAQLEATYPLPSKTGMKAHYPTLTELLDAYLGPDSRWGMPGENRLYAVYHIAGHEGNYNLTSELGNRTVTVSTEHTQAYLSAALAAISEGESLKDTWTTVLYANAVQHGKEVCEPAARCWAIAARKAASVIDRPLLFLGTTDNCKDLTAQELKLLILTFYDQMYKHFDLKRDEQSTAAFHEINYDMIFGCGLSQRFARAYNAQSSSRFDYYDPDTSYEEDVQYFIQAVRDNPMD